MTTSEKRDNAFEESKRKNYAYSLKLEGMTRPKDKSTLPKHVQQYINQLKEAHG
jgi:hypothetical protein